MCAQDEILHRSSNRRLPRGLALLFYMACLEGALKIKSLRSYGFCDA